MNKPKKLQRGDNIAIVSPSCGLPSVFPHVYETGLEVLKSLGLNVVEYPSARKSIDFLSINPDFRANDINNAFSDNDIKGIISTIGGDDSIRILKYLDDDIIKNNPKVFMGFSDTTTLNSYINRLGQVTLNGPSVMAGLSQWEYFNDDFKEHIKSLLFDNPMGYEYNAFNSYCEGFEDWANIANKGKLKPLKHDTSWNILQGEGIVSGKLFGGCIEVFEMMKGTDYWPEKKFWDDKILFLETSEDKPSPTSVKFMLRNYGIQGIFDKISALLIGKPVDYTDQEKIELNNYILDIVKIEFGNDKLPIVTNMNFGHTYPQWILPLGINAEINCDKQIFRLTEKIFEG